MRRPTVSARGSSVLGHSPGGHAAHPEPEPPQWPEGSSEQGTLTCDLSLCELYLLSTRGSWGEEGTESVAETGTESVNASLCLGT